MKFEDCEDYEDNDLLLSAYCDGETDARETEMVERHLAACARCAEELRLLRLASDTLRALPEVAPPAALRGAILAATVQRPGWRQRLADALGTLGRPATIRCATALGCAALLVAVVRSVRHQDAIAPRRHSAPPMTASLPQPPVRVAEARQPAAPTPVQPAIARSPRSHGTAHAPAVERNTPVQLARLELREQRRSVRPRESGTMRVATALRTTPVAAPDTAPQPDGITIEPADMIQPTPAAPAPAEKVATAKEAGAGAAATTLTPIHLASDVTSAGPAAASQMVTLADLKRALRRHNAEMNIQADLPAGRDTQIRVEIVHGKF